MNNEQKYCIDCKHSTNSFCHSPKLGKSPVNGDQLIYDLSKCRTYNWIYPKCGHDGTWFEQKEKSVSFIQMIKQSFMSIWK